MEGAMEVEDDVFFADLNKQISLLITEDDEDHDPVKAHSPSVSLQCQAFSRGIHTAPLVSISHEQTLMRRERKGTGVFIPLSLHPRKKSGRGRFSSSSNTKLQKQSDHHNSRGKLPHATFTNNPFHTSFSLNKY